MSQRLQETKTSLYYTSGINYPVEFIDALLGAIVKFIYKIIAFNFVLSMCVVRIIVFTPSCLLMAALSTFIDTLMNHFNENISYCDYCVFYMPVFVLSLLQTSLESVLLLIFFGLIGSIMLPCILTFAAIATIVTFTIALYLSVLDGMKLGVLGSLTDICKNIYALPNYMEILCFTQISFLLDIKKDLGEIQLSCNKFIGDRIKLHNIVARDGCEQKDINSSMYINKFRDVAQFKKIFIEEYTKFLRMIIGCDPVVSVVKMMPDTPRNTQASTKIPLRAPSSYTKDKNDCEDKSFSQRTFGEKKKGNEKIQRHSSFNGIKVNDNTEDTEHPKRRHSI